MKREEATGQGLCIGWFRSEWPDHYYSIYAVANERITSPARGALLKKQGVTAGVADTHITAPDKKGRILYIEMKILPNKVKKGSTQEQWLEHQAKFGHKTCVIEGKDRFDLLEQFKTIVKDHMEQYPTIYDQLKSQ